MELKEVACGKMYLTRQQVKQAKNMHCHIEIRRKDMTPSTLT